MSKYIFTLCCILSVTVLHAQSTLNIKGGTSVHAKNGVQVTVKTDNFVNNGTYTDTTSTFNMQKAGTFSGTGTTGMYKANFNFGAMVLNELVSVYNTATIAPFDTLNANNNLWIRYDVKPAANLVVNGVLTGNVQGLTAIGSVTSGGCPFFVSVVSTNVSGPVMKYQWQSSPDSTTWTTIPGATNATYTATVAHTTYYRANLTTTNSSFSESTAGAKLLFTGIYPEPIRGNPVVCVGQTLLLSDTSTVGYWTSVNTSIATVGSTTGLVSGVTSGTATISYTLLPGCGVFTTLTVNPLPSPIGGTPVVCAGSTTLLTDGGTGNWTSSNPGLATVGSSSGLVTGIVAGTPTITYALQSSGCYVTTPVTVNPLPAPITGSNAVCYGLTTTLNDATPPGTWTSSAPLVATIGSSSGLVTAVNPAGGTTTISYTLSTGCASTMTVTVNKLPTGYTLNPGGVSAYCPGTPAPDVYLSTSDLGVNYQLYDIPSTVGSPLAGTGSTLDFGPQTAAGTYKVIATNATTGCIATMPGNPVISINPVPPVDTLAGSNGGNYCAGSAGADLYIIHSTTGMVYTLNRSSTAVGIAFGTTGSPADFGNYTVTGVYTATATNTFGCNSNMIGSITVTEDPLPAIDTVTGGGSYCSGSTGAHVGLNYAESGINYQLYRNDTATGLPSAGANSGLDFGAQTLAGYYSVIATNAATGCSATMADSVAVNINPLPVADTVQGGGSYCPGGTGVTVTLSGSETGVHYQLYKDLVASGDTVSGTGAALNFGLQTGSGTYTVVGTNTATGCTNKMNSSATVGIYPALTVDTLKASATSYCSGGSGVDFKLSGSTTGVKYYLYNTSAVIDSLPGSGGTLDYGSKTLAGTYKVIATNTTTGCSSNMQGNPSVVINALPAAYTVSATNGGNYCAGGTGVHIGLSFSDIGINYQLWKGASMIGSAVAGSTAAIDFGIFTAPGTYSVIATNAATLCTSNMTDTVQVKINALPTAYGITGGGSYCIGGTGKHIGLLSSDTGISYQLYNGPTPMGATIAGTGGSLDFGSQTATGLYKIVATNNTTLCTRDMTGTTVITTTPLPMVYNVTGGGNICAGGPGVHVYLSGSATGINYQVFHASIPMGSPTKGTGTALDLGMETLGGAYTVIATNAVSGCTMNMNDSAIITINPLPKTYTVTGGGSYCAGDTGVVIGMKNSDAGIDYHLYHAGVYTGVLQSGTGLAFNFAPQTTAGTYTVIGVDGGTGCSQQMSDSAVIMINPTPAVYTITGSGHYCTGGAGIPVLLSGSHTGISYQLYNGTALAGKPVSGTGGAISFGPQTGGTYTAIATNTATGCTSHMSSSGTVTADPLPDTFAITGGGHYCAGGAGVLVGQVGSVPGINYQLYNGITPVGLPVGGTGAVLNFGLETGAGTYTVKGTNIATGCQNKMSGSTDIAVDKVVTPSVTIATSTGDDSACTGATTVFTATAVNGGSSPTFQWSVNGIPTVGGNPYSYIAADADLVAITLTIGTDIACATTRTASKSVKMTVIPYLAPTASITITPGNNVCKGTTVSLSAATAFGGKAPVYTWLKNSVPVGAGTSYSYTPGASANGDVLSFMLNSNYRCRAAHTDSVFSNDIVMTVDSAQMPAFNIGSHLGPVIGVGQVDTFTATVTNGAGALLTYQWKVNNTPVSGATDALYINYNVFDGDVISCDVTRTGACGGQTATKSEKVINLKNVGVQQATTAANISVLPNPNNGTFTVKGTLGAAGDQAVTLELTDLLGQVVYKGKVTAHNGELNERIQLSKTIANGMYLLNVRSGAASNVFHVVVEQ